MSRPHLTKAKAVVDAAEQHPAEYGDIQKTMDATKNVTAAYEELAARQQVDGAPKVALPHKPKATKSKAAPDRPGVDTRGVPIPPHLAEAFAVTPGIDELVRDAKSMRDRINRMLPANAETATPGLESLSTGRARLREWLGSTERMIADARPTIVCLRCNGAGCAACHDLGYIIKAHLEIHLKNAVADGIISNGESTAAAGAAIEVETVDPRTVYNDSLQSHAKAAESLARDIAATAQFDKGHSAQRGFAKGHLHYDGTVGLLRKIKRTLLDVQIVGNRGERFIIQREADHTARVTESRAENA